jgi:hypothetical protein
MSLGRTLVIVQPASGMISVASQQAAQLCGRPLDWIELVTGA